MTGIGCILIKETVHEDVVGLKWLGTETSGGPICETQAVHRTQGISSPQNCWFLKSTLVAALRVISNPHKC